VLPGVSPMLYACTGSFPFSFDFEFERDLPASGGLLLSFMARSRMRTSCAGEPRRRGGRAVVLGKGLGKEPEEVGGIRLMNCE
jgi:hypothetical protein